VDAEGTMGAWLDRIGARYVLIRPDFYVALTADTAATLQSRFAKVMRSLHLAEAQALAAE
jgi:3-(3-hydroxy-phenyl)propionate hydroxylase